MNYPQETTQCSNQKSDVISIICKNGRLDSNTARLSYWKKKGVEHLYQYVFDTTSHLPDGTSWKERVYHFIYDLRETPKCTVCGEPVKLFYDIKKGYAKTCSLICSNKSVDRSLKIKNTFMGKDKQDHVDRIKKGFLEVYGVDNISKTEYFKERYKEVMFEKYGVLNYFCQTDVMKAHWTETLGVENPQQHPDIKKKTMTTVESVYGSLQGCVPLKQYIKTNNERYGSDHFWGSKQGCMSHVNLKDRYGWTDVELDSLSRKKNSMSFDWALRKSGGDVDIAHVLLTGRMTSTHVPVGIASQESLKCLIPIYKYIRRIGIDRSNIYFGVSGSKEYFLYDIDNKRTKWYDFTVIQGGFRFIIEYNGVAFHPKTPTCDWKSPYSPIAPSDKYEEDRLKVELAVSRGFKVLTIWSDVDVNDNIMRCKLFIDKQKGVCG